MKKEKSWRLLGIVLVAVCVLFLSKKSVFARLTGTNPTGSSSDAFCVGAKSKEACVDSSGNVIPTTTATQTLGTSSLVYSNVFASGLTMTGPATLQIQTTTQIALDANPAGSVYLVTEAGIAGSFNVCASTDPKAGDFVYISSGSSAGAPVLGAKCNS